MESNSLETFPKSPPSLDFVYTFWRQKTIKSFTDEIEYQMLDERPPHLLLLSHTLIFCYQNVTLINESFALWDYTTPVSMYLQVIFASAVTNLITS